MQSGLGAGFGVHGVESLHSTDRAGNCKEPIVFLVVGMRRHNRAVQELAEQPRNEVCFLGRVSKIHVKSIEQCKNQQSSRETGCGSWKEFMVKHECEEFLLCIIDM